MYFMNLKHHKESTVELKITYDFDTLRFRVALNFDLQKCGVGGKGSYGM